MEFKLQKPDGIIKNKVESEIQSEWNDTLSKVEQIRDGLGKPIDQGIKETVAALLVSGFVTSNSCEGHLDHGRPYPYIDIKHKLDSPGFKEKTTIFLEQVKDKGYKTVLEIPESDEELYSMIKKLREEYENYRKQIETRIKSALSDFYVSHTPSSKDFILTPWEGGSYFSIQPISGAGIGLDNWKKFEEKLKLMSQKEKENYLNNSRTEMKAFTEFLKDKFFKDFSN